MKLPPLSFRYSLPLLLSILLTSCVTHITTDLTRNPPPTEKFSAFTQIELQPARIAPPYAGQEANEQAIVKIQENIDFKMKPWLANWNRSAEGAPAPRTLVITPEITEIKFINATARVWAGAFAGSSAVVMKVRITEKETGQVIATPLFFSRAAAMGAAFTFGAMDNLMLTRVANRLTDYLVANYDTAVGGPTGQEPRE